MTEGGGHLGGQRRLRFLIFHIAGYFAVVIALAVINIFVTEGPLWFFWPMLGWGGVIAIHTAFVMGLFDGGKG